MIAFLLVWVSVVFGSSVPAIVFSNKLAESVFQYNDDYDMATELPGAVFESSLKELVNYCNSEAYVFVNQPGLTLVDFVGYDEEFPMLSKYIQTSSTAIKFERVEGKEINDIYERLMKYAAAKCNIDDMIVIEEDEVETYKAYIDAQKKIIMINLPELPPIEEENGLTRGLTLLENDKLLRGILGQLPSPDISVIYSTTNTSTNADDKLDIGYEILPDAFDSFKKGYRVERNHRIIDRQRPGFFDYRPKFGSFEYPQFASLDSEFIKENQTLILMIIGSTLLFLFVQITGLGLNSSTKHSKKELLEKKMK